ncbi:MAG: helix-turn-helix domain-containing protein [Bacteroidota bacterium]
MKLYIKNMVSTRCKMVVKEELQNLQLNSITIELGEVEIKEDISVKKYDQLKKALLKTGLELMDDQKAVLIEKIKTIIIERIHYSDELLNINFSDFLSQKLGYNYNHISNLFSETKGITIEHFIIAHKIERVKELLVYDELTLSEIADMMHYSSVSHLSRQFKKVTGLTPTFFKTMKYKRLNALENL